MHSHKKRPLVGVIDIGSNSVRLVVYDGLKRVPRPLFNEKVPCGLGKGWGADGTLNLDAKEATRSSMARFAYLIQKMGLRTVIAIATAAVRDASDGHVFIEELIQTYGIPIEIISGEREAYLAAQGIFASMHRPDGVAGDLGGGSLELVELSENVITHQTTMKAGTLRLLEVGEHADNIRETLRSILRKADWLHQGYPTFYAIGGGFRSIARVHMKAHRYPLSLIHRYEVDSDSLYGFLVHLLSLSADELAGLKGLSERRLPGFIPSVIALEEILRATGAQQVVFSYAGIREGVLHDTLSPELREADALTASLSNLLGKAELDTDYTRQLFDWQKPLFEYENAVQRRWRKAVCLIGEIAQPVSPDFRGSWAFEHILQASLYGISHPGRVAMALAMYHRYKRNYSLDEALLELLDKQDRHWARLAGFSSDIAYMLSGGTPELLDDIRLQVDDAANVLFMGKEEALSMVPATVTKRLDGLGEAFRAFCNAMR